MLFLTYKIPALFGWIMFLLFTDNLACNEPDGQNVWCSETHTTKLDESEGYTDIAYFKDRLIAVGTNGRIDYITKSGERILVDSSYKCTFNSVFSNDKILIVTGDDGTILYSFDGSQFQQAKSGTKKNTTGIASKNSLMVAGAENGTILTSNDGILWENIQTGAKGNILSLSANDSFFIGITDAGEIIKSNNGVDWVIKDYNKEYEGFYKFSKFKKILATQNRIVIIGTHDDGSPSILFSSRGNVWTERLAVYHDDEGAIFYLKKEPNSVTYDFNQDQFIVACDDGGLFILPSCTKCNKYAKIAETNLNALIYANNNLFIVGDEFSFFVQKL